MTYYQMWNIGYASRPSDDRIRLGRFMLCKRWQNRSISYVGKSKIYLTSKKVIPFTILLIIVQ